MRADRLIAALLVLQTRGKVTAAELAVELEVSERTARRDLEALAMSGIPVYSRHGRGGGWELVGGARTDLSGLSADEARAMFLAAGAALASNGVDPTELRSAMRKLTVALPATFQAEAEAASTAIKIDAQGWGRIARVDRDRADRGRPSPPRSAAARAAEERESESLKLLTDAVVSGRQVSLFYDSASTDPGLRTVSPLGLVTKRNVWYLVSNTERGTRTYRLSRISNISLLQAEVDRPDSFDLDEAWAAIITEVESRRLACEVEAWVDASVITPVRWIFTAHETLEHDHKGQRFRMVMREVHEMALAAQLAGFGSAIELINPSDTLLEELRRIARELADAYL